MSIEAMKQALHLLETCWGCGDQDTIYYWNETAQVLRQAIEQAENAVLEEREACAKLVEADGLARGEYGYMLTKAATRIRARGAFVHASDMSQERVDETAKDRHEWVGLTDEEIGTLTVFDGLTHIEVPILADFIRAIEAKLKEKNCSATNNS